MLFYELAASADLVYSQVSVQFNWNNRKKFSFFKLKIKEPEFFVDRGKLLMNNLFHFTLLFEYTGTAQSFLLRISSVNLAKSGRICGFGHIY